MELIGEVFEGDCKWNGCAIGNDGCLYAVPGNYWGHDWGSCNNILKIDPSNDSTDLVGPDLEKKFDGCITGPDGCIYGFPNSDSNFDILKYDPITREVTMVRAVHRSIDCNFAVVGTNGMIYFFYGSGVILQYSPVDQSNSFVSNDLRRVLADGFAFGGAETVLAGDGYIYLIPDYSDRVMRFDPSDGSTNFIGDDFGSYNNWKWRGAVLGPDGNVYGIPNSHSYILKIDVAAQTTSLVGPDLGTSISKYNGGVVGQDNCIYMVPCLAEFVLKFNPITGVTSTVGESLVSENCKYNGGALASNGYIYLTPDTANQVLKVKSWDDWLYLKPRLLVEQGRAEGRIIQSDDELSIVQHFIIHSIDDIFRTVLEMM